MLKKGTPASPATAFANKVLPVPGAVNLECPRGSGGHPRTHFGVTIPARVIRAHRLESHAHTGHFQGHMYTQVGVVPGSHVHTGRGGVGGVGDESVRRHSLQGHMYTQVGVGRGQVSTY